MFARHAKHLALLSWKDGGGVGLSTNESTLIGEKTAKEEDSLSFNTNTTVM
jgi:hypothetical protein